MKQTEEVNKGIFFRLLYFSETRTGGSVHREVT